MTPPDDFPGDMHWFPLDDGDADVTFGASSGPGPVPEELRDVTELVQAARRPGSADEIVGADVIVAQIVAAVGEHVSSPTGDANERISVLSKFRTAKLAAATTAILVLGATAAAAATGTLPSPAHHQHSHHAIVLAAPSVAPAIPVPAPTVAHHTAKKHGAHAEHAPGAFGEVASVNGVTDPNTCGIADSAGVFTLTTRRDATFTVNVDTTTAYLDKGVTGPSFANVCVGSLVAAKGTVADTTVTATKIIVIPPRPHHERKGAFGIVASVNGVSDPNTCGISGAAGSFTLTAHADKTFTVNVDPTTTYADKDVTDSSFANVCVGAMVAAKGTVVDTTVTATDVFIAPVKKEDDSDHDKNRHGVFGTVASVNGVSDPNTCGTADAAGSFTITGLEGTTFTVTVDSSTKFFAPGVTDPSFGDICVGGKVGAKGDTTDTTVAATMAFVLPQHDPNMHSKRGHGNCDTSNPGSVHRAKTTSADPQQRGFGGGEQHKGGFAGGQNKGHGHGGHHHNG